MNEHKLHLPTDDACPRRGYRRDAADVTVVRGAHPSGAARHRGWSLTSGRTPASARRTGGARAGTINPNLATLARIGDAFGVPVTQLVDVGGEPAVRISYPDASRVLWHGPSGGTGTIIGATDPPWAVESASGGDAG